jgi:hypothetical protein
VVASAPVAACGGRVGARYDRPVRAVPVLDQLSSIVLLADGPNVPRAGRRYRPEDRAAEDRRRRDAPVPAVPTLDERAVAAALVAREVVADSPCLVWRDRGDRVQPIVETAMGIRTWGGVPDANWPGAGSEGTVGADALRCRRESDPGEGKRRGGLGVIERDARRSAVRREEERYKQGEQRRPQRWLSGLDPAR